MRVENLELEFKADRTAVLQGTQDAAVRLWFSLRPVAAEVTYRPPATVVVLLDCSGTVRRFEMETEEVRRWIELARERSELGVVDSDRQTVYQLKGRTLEEVRALSRCALSIASGALRNVADSFRESDVISLVGFATDGGILYDGRREKRERSLQDVLRDLERDPSSANLGDGTRMARAAHMAGTLLRSDPSAKRVRRLIIITDGIIEDRVEALRELEEIRNLGVAATTIGVGQEFDEEFLTRIADWTGGGYQYAPRAEDIEARLREDFGVFQTVAARDLTVSARGLGGAVVSSVTQLTPQMRMFEEIRLRGDWFQVEVGDVSGTVGLGLMGEFSLPWLALGKHSIGEVQLDWLDPKGEQSYTRNHVVHVDCLPLSAPMPEPDPEVEELFMRLQVYRAERAAQWAREGGRPGLSTVRLREASEILSRLGERELAEQFERQAVDVEAEEVDSGRTKTIKDWVRRLAERRSKEEK